MSDFQIRNGEVWKFCRGSGRDLGYLWVYLAVSWEMKGGFHTLTDIRLTLLTQTDIFWEKIFWKSKIWNDIWISWSRRTLQKILQTNRKILPWLRQPRMCLGPSKRPVWRTPLVTTETHAAPRVVPLAEESHPQRSAQKGWRREGKRQALPRRAVLSWLPCRLSACAAGWSSLRCPARGRESWRSCARGQDTWRAIHTVLRKKQWRAPLTRLLSLAISLEI